MSALAAIRVFLSYSWDSPEHKQRVLDFAQRLRVDGIDARMDRFTPFPEEGWARWMVNQIGEAQFVVIVATEKYAQRFAGKAPGDTALGATWEGAIITQELCEAGARNKKFLPAIFAAADVGHIPKPLRQYTHFRVDGSDGYDALYRQITGQPEVVPAVLGSLRSMPGGISGRPPLPPLAIPVIHDHAAARSNLPRLPYGFFGREDELKRIASSLSPDARTWGALIDGAGGIGKTALAIRAAELTPPGQFRRIIFLSSKDRDLTPDGERALANFVVPAYLDMLNELARQIDQADLTKSDERQRPALLQQALQGEHALLIFDNLESLLADDRERLFDFLSRLPRRCKAIVTSRRRTDIDARVIRLERLGKEAALDFIAKLAEDRPLLRKSIEAERISLYTGTGGNPLLIRWVAGRLGRSDCFSIDAALKLLASAPASNDPLTFIFGGLTDTFTAEEIKALATLSHFTLPAESKFIAELTGLSLTAAQTALEDLADRALVNSGGAESRNFALMPQVANFLRHKYSEAVFKASQRLTDHACDLVVENGYRKYTRFPVLESQWSVIAAALRPILQGPNKRLQTVCMALMNFLNSSGRWDEWLMLELLAEKRAVASQDFLNAGWRAYQAGYASYLRGDAQGVLSCANRAAAHWHTADAANRDRASAIRLRGHGYQLAKDYPAAIAAYREAVAIWRSLSPESDVVAVGLSDLAKVEQIAGDLVGAERDYKDALRIARATGHQEGIAIFTGNLAAVVLDRKDWPAAEKLAREALPLAEKVGRKELIATNLVRLAKALARQGRKAEAIPHARKAVEFYTALNSPAIDRAHAILAECQA